MLPREVLTRARHGPARAVLPGRLQHVVGVARDPDASWSRREIPTRDLDASWKAARDPDAPRVLSLARWVRRRACPSRTVVARRRAQAKLDFKTIRDIFASGFSRIPIYANHVENVIGLLFVKVTPVPVAVAIVVRAVVVRAVVVRAVVVRAVARLARRSERSRPRAARRSERERERERKRARRSKHHALRRGGADAPFRTRRRHPAVASSPRYMDGWAGGCAGGRAGGRRT